MSEQAAHALKQAGIMVALAALGSVALEYTGVLEAVGVPNIWFPVVGSLIAAIIRYLEGLRDGNRAAEGKVIPSDVAYDYVLEKAQNPTVRDAVEKVNGDVVVGVPALEVQARHNAYSVFQDDDPLP